jgi:hypothetical protein
MDRSEVLDSALEMHPGDAPKWIEAGTAIHGSGVLDEDETMKLSAVPRQIRPINSNTSSTITTTPISPLGP